MNNWNNQQFTYKYKSLVQMIFVLNPRIWELDLKGSNYVSKDIKDVGLGWYLHQHVGYWAKMHMCDKRKENLKDYRLSDNKKMNS
jgi:hypothetical protein